MKEIGRRVIGFWSAGLLAVAIALGVVPSARAADGDPACLICTANCREVCSDESQRCENFCRQRCRATCQTPSCNPGAGVACNPAPGACGVRTCLGEGRSYGPCTPALCSVCTPGSKQDCDYRGAAGTSHCALGERTCNSNGNGYGGCSDPTYRCGTWSTIDVRECAFTGVAKHAGILSDIPSGDDKQAYVMKHPATVHGLTMTARAYSSDLWGNSWGTFAVPNSSCFVFTLQYVKACFTPFSGSILYSDPNTGMTFRESAGFPCFSNCFGSNYRWVSSTAPKWGSEQFPSGGGGPPRCEVVVGGPKFDW